MKKVHSICIYLFVFSCVCGSVPRETFSASKIAHKIPVTMQKKLLEIDGNTLVVEIADTDEFRQVGLMYRKKLAKDHGMFFVYDKPKQLNFWMKNTYIALDLAYINQDMEIVQIEHMQPLNEDIIYSSKVPVQYVLEVNEGWLKANNIEVGNKIANLKDFNNDR